MAVDQICLVGDGLDNSVSLQRLSCREVSQVTGTLNGQVIDWITKHNFASPVEPLATSQGSLYKSTAWINENLLQHATMVNKVSMNFAPTPQFKQEEFLRDLHEVRGTFLIPYLYYLAQCKNWILFNSNILFLKVIKQLPMWSCWCGDDAWDFDCCKLSSVNTKCTKTREKSNVYRKKFYYFVRCQKQWE